VYRPFKGSFTENVILYLNYVFFHIIVDEITRRYGTPNNTTVRNHGNYSFSKTTVLRLYSFYQFCAIATLITPTERLGDMGFNTIIAIQSSAFLMTLFRKSLIPWYGHFIVYFSCLILSETHMFFVIPNLVFWLKVVAAFFLRTHFKINKFMVWGLFTLSAYPAISTIIPTQISTEVYSLIATHSVLERVGL